MTLKTFVVVVWGAFGVYWVVAALGAKEGSRSTRTWPPGLLVLAAVVVIRILKPGSLAVQRGIASDRRDLVPVRSRPRRVGEGLPWSQLGNADDPEGGA